MTGERHASEAGLNAATCVQRGNDYYYDDEDDGTKLTTLAYRGKVYMCKSRVWTEDPYF